jgi:hypothetical protein
VFVVRGSIWCCKCHALERLRVRLQSLSDVPGAVLYIITLCTSTGVLERGTRVRTPVRTKFSSCLRGAPPTMFTVQYDNNRAFASSAIQGTRTRYKVHVYYVVALACRR